MKKSFALLALLASLICTSCGKNTETSTAASQSPVQDGVQLVVWNDFHSGLYESVDVQGPSIARGGLPVWMAAVEELKGNGLSMVLDAGDMFQGATPLNELKGMGMIEIMNTIGLDAATFGNHEFDYGPNDVYGDNPRGTLLSAIAASNFQWVNANITAPDAEQAMWPPKELKPYTIIQKGPYRIAVTGVTTVETKTTTNVNNIVGLEFENPAKALTRVIPEIVKENPDFIIVLGHLTGEPKPLPAFDTVSSDVTYNNELGEIMALPDDIKKHIGLLVTGHLHITFLVQNGELIASQGAAGGRELTSIKLVPKKDGKGLTIDPSSLHKYALTHAPIYKGCGGGYDHPEQLDVGGLKIKPDERGYALTTKFEKAMSEGLCDVMACTTEPFFRNPNGESALADLMADAQKNYFPDADAALLNAGALRTDLPKGELYRETVASVMPFENKLQLVDISGEELVKVLKMSSTLHHRIMEVSNIEYEIQPDCGREPEDINGDGVAEDWEISCLCDNIRIAGEPLKMDKRYKVAMTDFIFNGGDALLGIFKTSKLLEDGPIVKRVIMDYLSKTNACMSESQFINPEKPRIKTTGTCASFL